MAEGLLALVDVVVLAILAEVVRAALDGRGTGAPAITVALAPFAAAARLLRRGNGSVRWRLAGLALLAAAGAQTAVAAGAPVEWLGVTALLRWVGVAVVLPAKRRAAVIAVLSELLLTLAVAAPVVASGAVTPAGIAAAQHEVWFAATMPVALLAFLIASAATWSPLTVAAEHASGGALTVLAARTLLLASAVAAAVPLYLGGGAWPASLGKAAVLLALVLLVGRRFPRVGARVLPLRVPAVALAFGVAQLAVAVLLGRVT